MVRRATSERNGAVDIIVNMHTEVREWKTQHSEIVHKDEWISVRSDECVMPSGVVVDPFYVLEYPPWVNVLAIDNCDRVIAVRQYRQAVGKVTLELPSGRMESTDSTPEAGARRELQEETGLTFAHMELLGIISPNTATHTNANYCFYAENLLSTGEQSLDSTEDIEVVRIDIDKFMSLVLKGGLPQALHISTVFFWMARKKVCDL